MTIIAFLTTLLPILAAVVEAIYGRRRRAREIQDRMAQHTSAELRHGTEQLQSIPFGHPPV